MSKLKWLAPDGEWHTYDVDGATVRIRLYNVGEEMRRQENLAAFRKYMREELCIPLEDTGGQNAALMEDIPNAE